MSISEEKAAAPNENFENRTPLLRVEDLSKSFSGFQALCDVSFGLSERDILGIIGPNGGIFVPTLGALYLASTLLLAFIAIRAIAQDQETGALKLLLQMPVTPAWLVTTKVAAVAIAVVALFLPALSFVPIWLYLGGMYTRQSCLIRCHRPKPSSAILSDYSN